MLKVAVPSNTSDSNSSSSNATSNPGDVDAADGTYSRRSGGRGKKRRWVCAKVKAGALKVRALVTSDSSSSSSESEEEGGSDRESERGSSQSEERGSHSEERDSGADSGFGEDHGRHRGHDRPSPLQGSTSVVSFADAPSATAQAAHTVNVKVNPDPAAAQQQQLCVVIPTPFDDGEVAPISTLNTPLSVGAEGASASVAEIEGGCVSPIQVARAGDGDGGGDDDLLSRSSPGPLAGITLIDSLPLGDHDHDHDDEGGEEGGGESTAWELSSSSGDDETNVFSATRSGSRSRSRSYDKEQRHGQGTSPPSSHAFSSPRAHTHTHNHTRPESPGSYVARMQRILAQVHETTSSSTGTGSTSRSPDRDNVDMAHAVDTARKTFDRQHDVINGAAVVGGAVASSEAVRKSAVAHVEGSSIQRCWDGGASRKAEWQPQPGGLEQPGPYGLAVTEGTTELELEEEGVVYVDFEEPESRRDLELLVAAVSAMVGMMVPESYRWVLWLACSAVTVWFPLKNQFSSSLGWPSAWWSCAGDEAAKTVDLDADQDPPPPYVDVDVGVDVCVGGDMDDASRAGDEPERGEEGGLDDEDMGLSGGPANSVLKGREEQLQYAAVLAGLSKAEVEFASSAGEEEEMRLLHQCLEYANYDTAGAIKVCSTFCRFRMKEGWALVLSALELEGPLRSRVHTVTTGRDRIGRGIITFSPGKLDMKKAPPVAYHKMLCYVLQEVLKEEELQTKGLVLLVDARDVGLGLLRHVTMADYKRGLRMLGGAFPAKVKAIRILHLNRAISIALSIAMPLLSAKMRARVEIVTSARARDGSFTNELAEPSFIPADLGIQGQWTGADDFWGKWVEEKISAERRLAR